MNREMLQPQNIFTKGNINPNINFISNQPEIKFCFRQQMPTHVPHPTRTSLLPSNHQPYERYSHEVPNNNQPQQNNAFVHLKNEINNLRTQFSKLIQKDNVKITDYATCESKEKEKKGTTPNKLVNRMPTYSTIGFYNKVSQKERRQPFQAKLKLEHNFTFKNKNSEQQKSAIIDKTSPDMKKEFASIDNAKSLTKLFLDKKEAIITSQVNKIQSLQKQIVKQNDLRLKAEAELQKRSKEFSTKQQNFQNSLNEKIEEIENLKIEIDQVNISLSLKNSLVQKLQLEIAKIKRQNESLMGQVKQHDESFKKMQERYQNQLFVKQQKYQKMIEEVMSKYRATQAQLIKQKQQKTFIYLQLEQKVKREESIASENKKLQAQIFELKEQIRKIVLQKEKLAQQAKVKLESQIQHKNQQNSNKELALSPQISNKLKNYQQENADLKKRVQSFKKSIQQLNNSNNSVREKYAQTKEQLRLLREETVIKEALINSLYRDIAILDNQMRQLPKYKSLISTNNKFIEDLNNKIVQLQLQKLSSKYIQQNEK